MTTEVASHELLQIPAVEYHTIDAVSASRLELFRRSPRLYQAKFLLGQKIGDDDSPRDALDLGTGTHAWVLEPDKFEDAVALVPPEVLGSNGTRNTKAYREWAQQNAGKALLKEADWERAKAMRRAIMANPVAEELIRTAEHRESSFVWEEKSPPFLIRKARFDLLTSYRGRPVIADIKTTTSVGPEEFSRSVHRYGYHRQAAFYTEAGRVWNGKIMPVVFVTVLIQPPHVVRVYSLSDEALALGQQQVAESLTALEQCCASGDWSEPGEDLVCELNLPKWAFVEDAA